MAVFNYVWQDPLIFSLVILNVVPLVILFLVKKFRSFDSDIRRPTKVHVFTPKEAVSWQVLDNTKPQSGHPVIFISNHRLVATQNPDHLEPFNAASQRHPGASADDKSDAAVEAEVGHGGGILNQTTASRSKLTAAGRRALLDRLEIDKDALDRTLTPDSPFDWNTESPITPASPSLRSPSPWK